MTTGPAATVGVAVARIVDNRGNAAVASGGRPPRFDSTTGVQATFELALIIRPWARSRCSPPRPCAWRSSDVRVDTRARTSARPRIALAAHSPYAWQADVDTTVVIPALALLYLFAVGRYGASRERIACFGGALLLLAVAFWTPLHHLGLHYLLTAHLLQNVILAEWAPLLAVLGVSRAMADALARRRVWRVLTHPAVALPVWLVDYFVWHVPVVYEAALHHQSWLIHAEHACYFATGLLVWWPLVHDVPHRLASGARAGYAFAAFVLAAPLGLLLALLPRAIYDFYVDARPRVWGLSPLADQELAGVTMASEQAVVLFVVFLFWFRRFLAEEG